MATDLETLASIHPISVDALASAEMVEPDELVIRPRSGWIAINWRELVRSRELLYFLIWRDVKIRYKQTALGVAWAVLQPLLTMLIFTAIFGQFAKIPSDGVPYPIFVFAGLVPWTFFANGVAQGGQSLVSQQQLLTKIYLPRLFIPTAAVGAFLVDMAISLGIYAVLLAFYRVVPSPGVVFLPILVVLTVVATLGLGYLLAALTVTYRDFRYVVPFMIQVLMYVSPVIYPVSMVPARFRALLALNPMAGLIEAYRSAILGTPWNPLTLGISSVSAVLLFVLGLFYFRKTERRFADIA
jgi:lipopolysaccharide transport system permease protein